MATKMIVKKNILGEEEVEAILKLRLDPRNTVRSRNLRKTTFRASSEANVGRVLMGKLIWMSRCGSLGLSQKMFADLLLEDEIRKTILTGDFEVKDLDISGISGLTIDKLERATGRDGAKLKTLSLLTSRLYNPLTKQAFTPVELQILQEVRKVEDAGSFSDGLLEGWDFYPDDLDEFQPKVDKFNLELDYELFYSDVEPPE